MGFTPTEWLGLVVFLGVWLARTAFDSVSYGSRDIDRKWYENSRQFVPLSPPSWLFGLVWSILYVLIGLAGFYFWKDGSGDGIDISETQYDVVLAVYFVNWILNKMWSPLFFGRRYIKLALIVLVLILATALTVAVLFGVYQNWLSFGLYLPYIIWLCYALFLNGYWGCCIDDNSMAAANRMSATASASSRGEGPNTRQRRRASGNSTDLTF